MMWGLESLLFNSCALVMTVVMVARMMEINVQWGVAGGMIHTKYSEL